LRREGLEGPKKDLVVVVELEVSGVIWRTEERGGGVLSNRSGKQLMKKLWKPSKFEAA
jgi:hypothetical protein